MSDFGLSHVISYPGYQVGLGLGLAVRVRLRIYCAEGGVWGGTPPPGLGLGLADLPDIPP